MLNRIKNLFTGSPSTEQPKEEARNSAASVVGPFNMASSLWGGLNTTSLTGHEALQIPAVYACIKVIRETTASLERRIERKDGKNWISTPSVYAEDLLNKPNSYNSFNELMMLWQSWYLIYGNSMIVPHRDRYGKTLSLHWRPHTVFNQYQDTDDGEIYYHDQETNVIYHSSNIAHLKDIWQNPFWGTSRLDRASLVTGKLQSSNELINKLNTNGLMLGGAVVYPSDSRVKPEDRTKAERYFNFMNKGLDKAGYWTFLSGGPSIHKFSTDMNLGEAQVIPATHLGIEDVCRIYSVPPHKIQHLVKSSYNSFEHLQINFMQDAIKPDSKLMAEELKKLIFTTKEQKYKRINFSADTLDMADTLQTITVLTQAVQNGLLNHDEARAELGRAPLPNNQGQKFYFAANNMAPIGPKDSNNEEE